MIEDWTEKYRPQTLKDVIGNPAAVKELRAWAGSWQSGTPSKRAAVLAGPPGIGKTTSAIALANDMGWGVVEMNASDQRTGSILRDVAIKGSRFNTFSETGEYLDARSGGRKLIVLDEADNLFGTADRGAMPVINELIRTTEQPVVLIVNDLYALTRKSAAVKSDVLRIDFRRPTQRAIAAALAAIAGKEGIEAGPAVLDRIAADADGDMRAAVRNLESLSLGTGRITMDSLGALGGRNVRKDMFDVVGAVFRNNDPVQARRTLMDVDTDPENAILWIDENLPYEYTDPGDLVRGYEKLSRADIFLGRVRRRQYYRFWAYASDLMTVGVASARMNGPPSRGRLRFPAYLSMMSRSRAMRTLKRVTLSKLAVLNNTSARRVESDILHYTRQLCLRSDDYRRMLIRDAGLEPDELGFLMGMKADSKLVRSSFEPPAETAPAPPEADRVPVPEPDTQAVDPKKSQSNLFDF